MLASRTVSEATEAPEVPDARPIVVLPAEVANQIAAGEVVERPASVLKELVENALDAGARTLTVVVDGGGVGRIAVTDDGAGMARADLELSVVRHATSKIRTAEDLVGVGTYGFRGEALASIASVARMKIVSRKRGAEEGFELRVEGSADAKLQPAGCAVGTTVSVEDLFFNTPARRKFLKSAASEWAACSDAVARMALPRPDVRFVLRRDGKVVREWLRHSELAPRVREIWPDEPLAELTGSRGKVKVHALLGPPERARSGTSALALYVNGRHVRDRFLMRALQQAFGSTLEPGRYPVGALLLELPSEDVDVNVHPQKSEVRFAEANAVFGAVVSVLRDALGTAPWGRSMAEGLGTSAPTREASNFWNAHLGAQPASPNLSLPLEAPKDFSAYPSAPTGGPESASTGAEADARAGTPVHAFVRPHGDPDPWGLAPKPPYPPVSYASAPSTEALRPLPAATGFSDELLGQGRFASLRYVAQLRRMFLVCEAEHGMVVLDQHAVAERVTFDRLRRAWQQRSVASQPLLVPETLEVTARDVALLEERSEELSRVGMELRPTGATTVAVRAVPAMLVRADPRRLARDLLAELGRHGSDFSRAVDLVLATMACHGSVRAGDELVDEEARALLRSLDEVDFAGHCPHGRPVLWSMRWTELERRVGR